MFTPSFKKGRKRIVVRACSGSKFTVMGENVLLRCSTFSLALLVKFGLRCRLAFIFLWASGARDVTWRSCSLCSDAWRNLMFFVTSSGPITNHILSLSGVALGCVSSGIVKIYSRKRFATTTNDDSGSCLDLDQVFAQRWTSVPQRKWFVCAASSTGLTVASTIVENFCTLRLLS